MTEWYPAFLNLKGRRCVVVGGGAVAERKLRALLACGAAVTVIAPRCTPQISAIAASGAFRLVDRGYQAADLKGAFLAVAATDSSELNARILADARDSGTLTNSVDDPEAGDFIVPATVRRDHVTLAVSTGGMSPAYARHLRQQLEAWLTPERVALLEVLADVRGELQALGCNPDPETWRRAIASGVLGALAAGDRDEARAKLLEALDRASVASSR